MIKKFFVTATATAALVLMLGSNATAADAGTSTGSLRSPVVSFTDHGKPGHLKDLVVEAGSDPSAVELHFAGARKVEMIDTGTLRITDKDGSTWRYKPTAHQFVNGKQKTLVVGFKHVGQDKVTIWINKYDAAAPVVIGPVDRTNGNS